MIGGCDGVPNLKINPAVVQNPDKVTGTVCLGPMRDQSQVRGVYLYSPADRIKDTTVAYGAAYPVGLTPTNESDTGLTLKATSVDGFRADGGQLIPAALGTRRRSPARATCCWASKSAVWQADTKRTPSSGAAR